MVRFSSVTVRSHIAHGTVRAVPVFGLDNCCSSHRCVYSVCLTTCSRLQQKKIQFFGSCKAVTAVPVPSPVPGRTVPTVLVFSSVRVLGLPGIKEIHASQITNELPRFTQFCTTCLCLVSSYARISNPRSSRTP